MGFVTLQLTSLQLVSTLVDCEQRPQVYVFDTWWTPCTCRLWNTVYLKRPYEARGGSVQGWVLLEVDLSFRLSLHPRSELFCPNVSDFDRLLHVPCFFLWVHGDLQTRLHSSGKQGYYQLPGTQKNCASFSLKWCKTLYLSLFMKQLFKSRFAQKFSCFRYYPLSRHRSPDRRNVTWMVAGSTLWMFFKSLSKSLCLLYRALWYNYVIYFLISNNLMH